MGWADDFFGGAKKVGKGVTKVADVATDTLIDKDAWINTTKALADGPGGREVKKSDLLNMALDSTMLIPGAGLAGGAARIGVRTAGKLAAKEAAEATAKKLAATELRSPLNNAIRRKAATEGDKLLGTVLKSGGGRRAAAAGTERTASVAGKRAGAREAEKATSNQIKRMALKQQKGIGKKVGFGQTKRRVLLNAALTGGANLGARGYDEGWWGPDPGTGSGASDGDGRAHVQYPEGYMGGGGGYGPGTMYLVGADGQQTEVPADFAAALATFMQQNGTVDGKQVIYNK